MRHDKPRNHYSVTGSGNGTRHTACQRPSLPTRTDFPSRSKQTDSPCFRSGKQFFKKPAFRSNYIGVLLGPPARPEFVVVEASHVEPRFLAWLTAACA